MDITMLTFAIMQSNGAQFESNTFSGFLGLGTPYNPEGDEDKNANMVNYLKTSGQIENAMVSFYLQKNTTSMIKFGSYDKAALRNPDDFHIYRTVDKKAWKVNQVKVLALGNAVSSE